MSADNGIYIVEFPHGFRVIHTQAIDNVSYFPNGSKEEKQVLRDYFGESAVYPTRDLALDRAFDLEKEIIEEDGILENGICDLGKLPEFLTEAELKELMSTPENIKALAHSMEKAAPRCKIPDYCKDIAKSKPYDKYSLSLTKLKELRETEDSLLEEMDKLWLEMTDEQREYINNNL